MVAQQGRRAQFHPRHRAQRHGLAIAVAHAQAADGIGPGLARRIGFQHHAVLAGLGEDGGDLTLPVGVVQRIGHGFHAHVQARGCIAVDVHPRLSALHLQVAGHIAQRRLLAQRLQQLRRPGFQRLLFRRGQGELVLVAADAVFDAQLLHWLQVQGDAGNLRYALLQPFHHHGGAVAVAMRLQFDQQAAGVERGVVAIHADVGRHAGHRLVGFDGRRQRLLALAHGLERDRLPGLADALHQAGILHREEALGHGEVQRHGQRQRGDGGQQHQRLALQHPLQLAVVDCDDAVEDILFRRRSPGGIRPLGRGQIPLGL